MKKFETKYGYFDAEGKEFVITDFLTPRPWVNVISNGNYGLVISQLNGGFSWIGNSNQNRLTRWHQDLIQDNWGRYIYLRNEISGEYWSPTVQPVGKKPDRYECRHGIGYTRFYSVYKNIESTLRIFVPFHDQLEIWTLTVKNCGRVKQKIGIYTYLEWCLGVAPDNHREFHKTFIETEFNKDTSAILARKRLWEITSRRGHWNTHWPYTAYFACTSPVQGYDADKESFIGLYQTLAHPQTLVTGKPGKRTGKWNDSIASLKKVITLNPGQEKKVDFLLGAEEERALVSKKVKYYSIRANIEKSFQSVHEEWEKILSPTQVRTPDHALNYLTNYWLKYQAISGRIWGRAAYYQQSGAFGFRDQLQDSQIFLYSEPDLTRQQIILHTRHQFKDGRVLHWWHPISEQGHDARMSDDLLWLPFLVVQYLKETGDWSILAEEIPYLDEPAPDTLQNHCLRAIDLTLTRFSPRRLPLILAGDWNDGLSAVGLEGKGESIWLGHFLYYVLREIIFPLERNGAYTKAQAYKQSAEDLKQALNTIGWDGEWFWRASKDNGDLIGSRQNKEGRIFLNAQTWAVISGTADAVRQKQVMKAVEKYLESKVGPVLLAPAYSRPDDLVGYLSRYAPGVRENGGVYTHAATWAIWAASLLSDSQMTYRFYKEICPVYNGKHPDTYRSEPYVTPGNIDGPDSINYGRGGWTWYTGSATWLFRVTVDFLLGIQADHDGLVVKPCYPAEWEEVQIQRLFRGVTYQIRIKNSQQKLEHPVEIWIENIRITGNKIPVRTGPKEVQVLVLRNV